MLLSCLNFLIFFKILFFNFPNENDADIDEDEDEEYLDELEKLALAPMLEPENNELLPL